MPIRHFKETKVSIGENRNGRIFMLTNFIEKLEIFHFVFTENNLMGKTEKIFFEEVSSSICFRSSRQERIDVLLQLFDFEPNSLNLFFGLIQVESFLFDKSTKQTSRNDDFVWRIDSKTIFPYTNGEIRSRIFLRFASISTSKFVFSCSTSSRRV